ncbi:MAG: hypothetical protein ABIK28_02805 [Planctomycetota bacterium]
MAWLCFYTACTVLLSGCGERAAENVRKQSQQAIRTAAADLDSLGYQNSSLHLLEEACRVSPNMEDAMEIVERFKQLGNEGEAGACLERLFPEARPEGLDEKIFDLNLVGWQWSKVRLYLDDMDPDHRRLKLEDIMSRSRSVRELFNRPYQLNWQIQGCTTKNMQGSLLLSSGAEPGLSPEGPAMFTSLGWNGRDFRQSMDLKILDLTEGAGLVWGLSAHPVLDMGFTDTTDQFILVEYKDGVLSLHSNGPRSNDTAVSCCRWYIPMNLWLQIRIEFVSGFAAQEGVDQAWAGKIRAIINERASGKQLLRLEIDSPSDFFEGRIAAGFLKPLNWIQGRSACEMYVDNFSFED